MRAFIDCEFNGFGGSLMSMAVVCENGREWYNVVEIYEPIDPWVAEHVVPLLGKQPVARPVFNLMFHEFLQNARPSIIIADWPADLVHFFESMLGADHSETLAMHIVAECIPTLTGDPEIPHNALSDARALMKAWQWQYSDKAAP